jgi:hypothetical protein
LKGTDAAEAFRAILERPELWSMDCATFVQVVELNALRETLGAAEFNRYMNEQKQHTRKMIVLNQHFSTGMRLKYGYERDEDTGQVTRVPSGPPETVKSLTMKDLVDDVPIGSEVVFHNPNAPSDHAFLYENAIKIGRDRYLAYPVGDPVVSGDRIRQEMATMTFPDGAGGLTARQSTKTIQISSIAVFDFFPESTTP